MRVLAAAAGFVAVYGLTYGVATSLGTASAELAAGDAEVGRCDTDGVSLVYTLVRDGLSGQWQVVQVIVENIDAGCTGGELQLTAVDGTGAALAAGGPQILSGTNVMVPLTFAAPAEQVAAVHIAITGP